MIMRAMPILRKRSTSSRSFTLVELVVAIGVIALIGLGIAAIFGAVGETVATGRRVSATTEAAAAFERRLRADVEAMTRDGFLVIRNEWANNGEPVPLTPDDLTPRPRRIDELMFFARGEFETARQPVLGGLDVRAGAAKIYYGHGQSLPVRPDTGAGVWAYGQPFVSTSISTLANPASTDVNDGGNLGAAAEIALGRRDFPDNPNRFASDWSLLRDVVLLRSPSVQSSALLDDVRDEINRIYGISFSLSEVADNDIQVNLQPAARSVFRSINRLPRGLPGQNEDTVRPESEFSGGFADSLRVPSLESGLVDIATTDLNEIKTIVTQSAYSSSITNNFALLLPEQVFELEIGNTLESLPANAARLDAGALTPVLVGLLSAGELAERLGLPALPTTGAPSTQLLVDAQHAWMADALPGWSSEQQFDAQAPNPSNPLGPQNIRIRERADGSGALNFATRSRRRFEPTPPAFYRNLADEVNPSGIDAAIFRADKAMLTASNFGVRCTEFIVEWSFGELAFNSQSNVANYEDGQVLDARLPFGSPVDPLPGNLVWYGAERYVNPNETDETGLLAAQPVFRDTDAIDRSNWRTNLATLIHGRIVARPESVSTGGVPGSPPLSGTRRPTVGDNGYRIERHRERPLTSYFGYADPRGVDTDGDGLSNTEWPWPRFIRVTASFADPNNPLDEETIQFVVSVPSDNGF